MKALDTATNFQFQILVAYKSAANPHTLLKTHRSPCVGFLKHITFHITAITNSNTFYFSN